jgi:hypothetical protein
MTVVPPSLLALTSAHELERAVCGSVEIDVDLLEKNTDYGKCALLVPPARSLAAPLHCTCRSCVFCRVSIFVNLQSTPRRTTSLASCFGA